MNSMNNAEEALRRFIPSASRQAGDGEVLKRMSKVMSAIGNPQNELKIIHIAGTSGKTSTAYYISALLRQAGKTVGLCVSPHVDKVSERVQVNGESLDDQLFDSLLKEFIALVEQANLRPTYFELLYAFSFWVFLRNGVDYAVVETGIGGQYDATNIATRADKVCVIADIGYDHMQILGNDIKQIAAQKAGIIHPGNVVIVANQKDDVLSVIKACANKVASKILIAEEPVWADDGSYLSELPTFQRRNWTLAKKTVDIVTVRDRLLSLSTEQLLTTQKTYIPARMETRNINGKTLIMDGAHNVQKLTALAEAVKKRYTQSAVVVISLKRDKNIEDIAPVLRSIASKTIATSFKSSLDLRVNAVPARELAAVLSSGGLPNVCSIDNQLEALKYAFKSSQKLIIVTGSFYLLSQIRPKLKNLKKLGNN